MSERALRTDLILEPRFVVSVVKSGALRITAPTGTVTLTPAQAAQLSKVLAVRYE